MNKIKKNIFSVTIYKVTNGFFDISVKINFVFYWMHWQQYRFNVFTVYCSKYSVCSRYNGFVEVFRLFYIILGYLDNECIRHAMSKRFLLVNTLITFEMLKVEFVL